MGNISSQRLFSTPGCGNVCRCLHECHIVLLDVCLLLLKQMLQNVVTVSFEVIQLVFVRYMSVRRRQEDRCTETGRKAAFLWFQHICYEILSRLVNRKEAVPCAAGLHA